MKLNFSFYFRKIRKYLPAPWVLPRCASRGLVRNNDLQVPVLKSGSNLERVQLSKSQNFADSAEPVELVLTTPLAREKNFLKTGRGM